MAELGYKADKQFPYLLSISSNWVVFKRQTIFGAVVVEYRHAENTYLVLYNV